MKTSKVLWIWVLALLLGAAHPAMGAPVNDDCSNAKAVGDVTNLPFDTTLATFDGPGHYITGPNIWFCYTATCTGKVTVNLCGSRFDTKLAVYRRCSGYPTADSIVETNDDDCAKQSRLTFDAAAGEQYLIEVGGFGSRTGEGIITIRCEGRLTPVPCQPSNDYCRNAIQVSNVTNLSFDTTCATFDGLGHYMTGPNIWYIYTATCTGQVTVDLCGSSFDTRLAVYRGYSCYPTASGIVATDNNACGQQSRVTFNATTGEKFLIEVGGQGSRIGRGVMSIYCVEEHAPPTNNDNCSDAKPVGNVTDLAFDTKSSTFDGPGHYIRSPNIWYCYTATCTGDVTVDLCGSSFDTMLAVYTGEGCSCYPTANDIIASNDDSCSQQSRVTFAASAGDIFLIEVGGYGSSTGSGVMTIRCEGEPGPTPCQPANDNCQNAKQVGNVTDLAFDTTCATFDGPGRFIISPNIWYIYTAAATGDVTVSLCGSEYDTKLAIYRGAACNPTADRMIKYNDDSCDWQSEATFAATAGQRYLIEVGGFGNRTGKGVITISSEGVTPPPTKQLDLGDAPDSTNNYGRVMTAYQNYIKANFPTVYNDGSGTGPYGPLHRNPQGVAYLGNSVSLEDEADIGSDQDGHNNIWPVSDASNKDWHDNGVTFPINMPNCSWTTFDYSVKVVSPGTNLWVNVWCDWNRDGDWDDDGSTYPAFNCTKGFVSEWAVQNQFLYNLPAGLHKLTTPALLPWHPNNGPKGIWMRITLSEKPWKGGSNPGSKGNGGSGPQAGYDVGETEDYLFTPETACSICEDYSGDGVINIEDLVAFITEWLQSCP